MTTRAFKGHDIGRTVQHQITCSRVGNDLFQVTKGNAPIQRDDLPRLLLGEDLAMIAVRQPLFPPCFQPGENFIDHEFYVLLVPAAIDISMEALKIELPLQASLLDDLPGRWKQEFSPLTYQPEAKER